MYMKIQVLDITYAVNSSKPKAIRIILHFQQRITMQETYLMHEASNFNIHTNDTDLFNIIGTHRPTLSIKPLTTINIP